MRGASDLSLRRTITLVMVALGGVAMASAVALILLTEKLEKNAVNLTRAVHSVRLAEEIHAYLLTHPRTRDDTARETIERRLQERIDEALGHVSSSEEALLLQRAAAEVERYLDQTLRSATAAPLQPELQILQADREIEGALRPIEELASRSILQAERARADAARWNQIADVFGIAVAALLIMGVAAVLVWLHSSAFRPVLRIVGAIQQFATGQRRARAPEQGPRELRMIARQFNSMAEALDRQHTQQILALAGVAHDLRNPLSVLKLATAVISPDRPLPEEERIKSTMSVVKRQLDRLDRMVSELLDTLRIESGHVELDIEDHDACALAQEAYDLFASASPTHDLVLSRPEGRVAIECDAARIAQVLDNLVSNAIKYSPAGGRVELAVEASDGEVVLRVSDHGPGIPPEELPHLFEPFRRGAAQAADKPGVGLGLSVSRRIVEAHGGKIDVESSAGSGTTIRVRLPREVAPAAAAAATAQRAETVATTLEPAS